MTTPNSENDAESLSSGLLCRSHEFVLNLPVLYRWETTRRHPYYLIFWEAARKYRSHGYENSVQAFPGYVALLVLGSIGVTGEPVAPATAFEELSVDEASPLIGSVQPMTLRSIVAMLIRNLPSADLEVIGGLFMTAGHQEYSCPGDDDIASNQRKNALARLMTIMSSSLDSYPDAPLYYIHLAASQRTIVDDIKSQVALWQKRRGEGSPRIRAEKFPSYMKVWDLREGWTGSGYLLAQELSFKAIAQQIGVPVSTVFSHYRAAFQLIFGHPFSCELWWGNMGPLKFSRLLGDPEDVFSAPIRHRFHTPVRRPVPESAIWTPPSDRLLGPVGGAGTIPNPMDVRAVLLDLQDLFHQGHSDDEIARRLDLTAEMVAHARDRISDIGEVGR
jgi:DNA-binding CsgD family transcriptional regulator